VQSEAQVSLFGAESTGGASPLAIVLSALPALIFVTSNCTLKKSGATLSGSIFFGNGVRRPDLSTYQLSIQSSIR
jgi:hypothetical protein